MFPEKNFSLNFERENEPRIIIKRGLEAPPEVKENPFYDPEWWGMAKSIDDIYLPDSDEAISFAIASHEIGHLVKEGERLDARLDNFEATRAEEERAWKKGWLYLQKYLSKYYQDNSEAIPKIQPAFERIRDLMMQATDLSQEMYLEKGALDDLGQEEYEELLKERREQFFSSKKGKEFLAVCGQIKNEKIGQKPDWNKFINVVTKAVRDILEDNKK